jgi:site-specific DNA-methyltransferase (adenine-specific)
LLRKGREAYQQADEDALAYLKGLDLIPVQRNSGIDALLKTGFQGGPVPIRIQRTGESLLEAARSLHKAAKTKNASVMILVATGPGVGFDAASSLPPGISIINATASAIHRLLKELEEEQA